MSNAQELQNSASTCEKLDVRGNLAVGGTLTVAGVPVVGGVQSDGVTLQGDGSAGNKLAIKAVQTDASLTGAGTVASPLSVAAGVSGIDVADEGVPLAGNPYTHVNFVGRGVTATDVAGVATVTVPTPAIEIQDEGVPLAGTYSTINFTGPGVTAVALAGDAVVTVPTPQTDNVTLQGDGLVGSKLALKAVQTDATLTGAGTVASPLHAVIPAATVQSDNVTLQGDGSGGSKLALKAVQTDATLTGAGTVASPLHVVPAAASSPFSPAISVATAFGGNFATVHDWAPVGFVAGVTRLVIITSQDGGTQIIGGLALGQVDGDIVTILKLNTVIGDRAKTISLGREDALSAAANRIAGCSNDSMSGYGSSFQLRYDGAQSRWVQMNFNANI